MGSRISTVNAAGCTHTPGIDTPQAGTHDQHDASQQGSQAARIQPWHVVLPMRMQRTAVPPSQRPRPTEGQTEILSSHTDASRASLRRASAGHETGGSTSGGIGGSNRQVNAVTPALQMGDGDALPLTVYTAELRSKFPNLYGRCAVGIFIESTEGKYQRCPFDKGYSAAGLDHFEKIGHAFARQFDCSYDVHPDSIQETKAGYAIDAQAGTVHFEVGGTPVSSISTHRTAFALPDKQYIFPAPDFEADSYACEEMLLAAGLPASEVVKQVEDPSSRLCPVKGWRESTPRDMGSLCWSLQTRSGRTPLIVKGDGLTLEGEVQKLKDGIAAHGPCIFEINGRYRMLDAIEETAQGIVLNVRYSFSASAVIIKLHDTFWTRRLEFNLDWCVPRKKWNAIFLPRC